ncbi:GNAT family N-acetyltransferase [Sediminibacillus massiliensis]|uniref:GNAT family N-acetyltransferase n=1 Tax=Sediminibacillus massiliensis TaxID=1926277 RepID=UPI000988348D|nr:GNAT family N-acetyltransferase [Sediminibacillus massiliensis]
MAVIYEVNGKINEQELAEVFKSSGIKRPHQDVKRLSSMIEKANLIITARENGTLIGVGRALTDFVYCCYLSDLAVHRDYQKSGVGRKILDKVREEIGEQTALVLLSAPGAMEYYPKVEFQKAENAFLIPRKS